MAYYGVDLDVRVKDINLQFKNQIRNRSGVGLSSLSNIFKRVDRSGNGKLESEEFE